MKKCKYIFSILMSLVLTFACFGLTACGENQSNDPPIDLNNSSVFVTYFPATGSTERVSNYIQDFLNADILKIQPQVDYTSEDLNWNNSSSRVSQEHNNRNNPSSEFYRPAIVKTIENFNQYDILFLGYPIWWGEAPNIVYTFLEEYSEQFSEKTIIPFCTSSSSGLGESALHLQSLVESSANWYSGQRFSSSANRSTIENWIDSLKL